MTPARPVLMATVGGAQGLRGAVRLRTFTADPLAVGDYGPLYASDGRHFAVLSVRPAKGAVIAQLDGIADRNAAEALAGTDLFVDRSALPDEALEDDEFFHADLIGLSVQDGRGDAVGVVVGVHDFGAGDVLEIEQPDRRRVVVPFSRAAVPHIDLASGLLHIDPIAAGLALDAPPDEKADSSAGREGDH